MYIMLDKVYKADVMAFHTRGPHEVIAKIARKNGSPMYLVKRAHLDDTSNGANAEILREAMKRDHLLYFAEDNGIITLEEIKNESLYTLRHCWWLNDHRVAEVRAVNSELVNYLNTDSF